MKRFSILVCLVFIVAIGHAQVSLRVKENPRGREVEINAKTNPSGNKNTNGSSKPETNTPPATSNQPPSTSGKPVADTAARPAATGKQDESYSGPAKVSLKSFWRQLLILREGKATSSTISNAERMLKQVKEQDPNYDVLALETEVAGYKAQANKEATASQAAADKEAATRNYFKDLNSKLIGVYSTGSDIQPGVTGKAYYDRMKEINLPEYQERKNELTNIDPKSYAGLVAAQLADYDDYVKRSDRFKWNVTAVIQKSSGAKNPQEKIALLNEAKYECMAVLMLSPNNDPFKKKLEEINKQLGNAESESAKFFTSDFHKEHLNQIVWSTKPLVIGKEKEMAASIKTAFKSGEAIFGTAYLGINVKDVMEGNDQLRVRIRIDGGTAVWGGDLSNIILPLTVQGKSYIQFALLPDAQWFKDNYAPYVAKENWTYSYLMDDLVKAGDISHEITCELIFPSSKISDIKSKLDLDLNGGVTDIKNLSGKLHNELMASRQLPKAGMSNAALEQQMVAAANAEGWNDKFSKAIITSSSWVVAKNELTGAILYRWLGAVCTTKSADGKCYYQEFSFKQDYTGGGNYSGPLKFNSYGGKKEIGCDKLK
ncbi:MAG: hypothetical protein NTW29_22830 [Bacteroidetes bacterium]|nr:hypothetical protein [Bacteroidota bacterium]